MIVKRIHLKDTYGIRKKVLGIENVESSYLFEGDTESGTFHLGAFIENNLVSVASFYFNRNSKFNIDNQYQLQGMATLEDFRKQGLSRELLNVAFPIIKQNFCNLVWCNARVEAAPFYQKLGFEISGDEFDVENIGKHILMYREIN
ncbi:MULTISPECIES: GNAT family N-acetyltransferase [Halobacteriovorax]|uniref:GNAT family N-acetyltransferase n=1 Tax=Halobacteriovorax vibrionivorans TaxID=2152716 RepID=A0ABY0IFB7_9BACT|nr:MULTISPECIES: GNAT family N-acetyltransferase [Halobacteriovorax]AYF44273.1 acetyltransferase (GNAT) domain protein [Halobacteriovorax sp. BALOs_7]RZF21200.1 GNAT family N-acetyltransferase [Halobacteriovorax vibrionivorans]TGD46840.1 GNAT family N-acetyltransferase [Halobacteriovorax sp. Y22]